MKTQIGSVSYDVKLISQEKLNEILPEELEGSIACISGSKNILCICTDLPVLTMHQSFFHEVVHGMLEEIGEVELNEDEGFVDAFAKQLYVLFTRNNVEKILKHIADKHDNEYKKNHSKSAS